MCANHHRNPPTILGFTIPTATLILVWIDWVISTISLSIEFSCLNYDPSTYQRFSKYFTIDLKICCFLMGSFVICVVSTYAVKKEKLQILTICVVDKVAVLCFLFAVHCKVVFDVLSTMNQPDSLINLAGSFLKIAVPILTVGLGTQVYSTKMLNAFRRKLKVNLLARKNANIEWNNRCNNRQCHV